MLSHTHTEEEILLVFTVLAVVVLSTFTGVAVGGTWFANAGGNVLTRVKLTRVHTLLTKITCRTERKGVKNYTQTSQSNM